MLNAPGIHHFGVLVNNLEEAIERWSRLTGWSFDTIGHYRPDSYVCRAASVPHSHDQRIAFSLDGPPFVELLEVNPSEPTHDSTQLGFHHICFDPMDDLEGALSGLAKAGVGTDGEARDADGKLLLFFADPDEPAGFDGVRVEYASSATQPLVREGGDAAESRESVKRFPESSP